MIRSVLDEGAIIPGEITIGLLKEAIHTSPAPLVLVDGFPRRVDQGVNFEKEIQPCNFAIYLNASRSILESRLILREHISKGARTDDNAATREKVTFSPN
jgi:adenylate kinase family enzyme